MTFLIKVSIKFFLCYCSGARTSLRGIRSCSVLSIIDQKLIRSGMWLLLGCEEWCLRYISWQKRRLSKCWRHYCKLHQTIHRGVCHHGWCVKRSCTVVKWAALLHSNGTVVILILSWGQVLGQAAILSMRLSLAPVSSWLKTGVCWYL